ncbi:hypothetical protein [Streptomyces inhibens]|nr:hypothetical protein [Streptomyces inhibens]
MGLVWRAAGSSSLGRSYAGKSPSVASLHRALAEAENAAADDGLPVRPKPRKAISDGRPA